MYTFSVLTVSDKGYSNERQDLSGEMIKNFFESKGNELKLYTIVPDELDMIQSKLEEMADKHKSHVILTTGGTGFSPRDITPEATKLVIERDVPGIPEAIRAFSMTKTPRAMLSRAVCGIRGKSLILNMPGSPKAISETLDFVYDSLIHGLDILNANASECANDRK